MDLIIIIYSGEFNNVKISHNVAFQRERSVETAVLVKFHGKNRTNVTIDNKCIGVA